MEKVYCSKCGKECKPDGISTGYGVMPKTGEKVCYSCCGELDKQQLLNAKPGDKFYLYLTRDNKGGYYVSNWPGSFKIPVCSRIGYHNIAGDRYDFWFSVGNRKFHGVMYGNNTEVAHIRCLKK